MSIVSLAFFAFVAAVILLYFLIPLKYRWIVLLAGSYVFYWLNSHWLVFVLLGESLVTYGIGLWIRHVNDKREQYFSAEGEALDKEARKARKKTDKRNTRLILVLGIVVDVGILLFLKYFNFFGSNMNHLLRLLGVSGDPIPRLNLLVPLGISFYTLQAIAYMTDVYREKIRADRNPAKFMLFMSFFPQIVQGPIHRHSQIAEQLYEGHRFEYKNLCFGAQLALWGLMKKLIIADRLAVAVQSVFGKMDSYSGPIFFFAALLYGVQIYTDFSGGMDIARGVAQTMGIRLEMNFDQPFFASSIENFWRRWHMTLGAWMRDYVFYPLSLSKAFTKLSRKSRKIFGQFIGKRLPAFLAMFIVFLLVGFWHGANWLHVAFGLWNSIFIMSSIMLTEVYAKCRNKLGIREESISWRIFCMIRTTVIITFGRFFPCAGGVGKAFLVFKKTFTHFWDVRFLTNGTLLKLGLKNYDWIILAVAVAVLLAVDIAHENKVEIREGIAKQHIIFRWIIYLAALLVLILFGMYGSATSASSFIYEQF